MGRVNTPLGNILFFKFSKSFVAYNMQILEKKNLHTWDIPFKLTSSKWLTLDTFTPSYQHYHHEVQIDRQMVNCSCPRKAGCIHSLLNSYHPCHNEAPEIHRIQKHGLSLIVHNACQQSDSASLDLQCNKACSLAKITRIFVLLEFNAITLASSNKTQIF